MAVSLMATASAKATFADVEQVSDQYQEAVEVLQTLKIMVGNTEAPTAEATDAESDTATTETTEATKYYFHPKATLTRGEFAVVLFKLRTGANQEDEQYAIYKDKNYYTDVPASKYAAVAINYLHDIKAMNGVGGGEFAPDDTISVSEVLVSVLQAIGYSNLGENWAETQLQAAAYGQSTHLTTGMGLKAKDLLNREQLANILFNALTEKEAHVVKLNDDGKYVSANEDEVTLGEINWELHLYTRSSGSKYPSDRKISIALDPFGRPTNPKWVAVVDGEVKTIGTENKALIEYYQKDPITRKELEADFYTEFAFKDYSANIEYYVDGDEVEDPWVHSPVDEDYDTIGGTAVTVEVYMMADKYVAISHDLVDMRLWREYGDTEIDQKATQTNTWPKMRVIWKYRVMQVIGMMIILSILLTPREFPFRIMESMCWVMLSISM